MLRTMMRDAERKGPHAAGHTRLAGDEPFLRSLRKLRADYEGRPVSTAELMAVFESELPASLWYEGHKSLEWFYGGLGNGNAVARFSLQRIQFVDEGTATM